MMRSDERIQTCSERASIETRTAARRRQRQYQLTVEECERYDISDFVEDFGLPMR